MNGHWRASGLLLFGLAWVACGDDGGSMAGSDGGLADGSVSAPLCSAEELSAALDAAQPGDTVVVGACEITGSFTVGADVSLVGQGAAMSKIIAEPATIALNLEPGAGTTRIANLSVDSGGFAAIGAMEPASGEVVLNNLEIAVRLGGGILVSGPARVTMEELQVRGNLSLASPPAPLPEGEEARSFSNSTYVGVLLEDAQAEITNLVVSGFAMAGAAFLESQVSWSGGESTESYLHGIYLLGGSSTLSDVKVEKTLTLPGGQYAYGLVAFQGANVAATRLNVSQNDRYGVVQLADTIGTYADLTAGDNGAAALWVQQSKELDIVGMNGFMSTNTMSGVVVRDTDKVSIREMTIEDTQTVPHIIGNDVFLVGDGIQIFDSFADIQIQDSRVSLNGRAGILLESSSGVLPDGIFSSVTANSADGALGVIAQSSTDVIPAGDTWDQGVTREGDATSTDLSHSTRLVTSTEIVGMNGIIATPPVVASAAP